MFKLNNAFAIGCLVQFYEIEIIEDFIKSLKYSKENIENNENVTVDICFNLNQGLEKLDETKKLPQELKDRMERIVFDNLGYFNIKYWINEDKIYTIADYRREFNEKYCEKVDVLMWGESDSLIPRQTFEILDNLHTVAKETTPKYVGFFSTCKMWDDTWKVLEHPDFTDKPFTEGDTENWWSLRYIMSQEEMDKINDKVEDLDIQQTTDLKFNGCGLVISSDVIKSGVNIPKSAFFIHEDTAFMLQLQKLFGGEIPQYIIKNIHN